MPRFQVTRGKNGMAQTSSIRPPGEKPKGPKEAPHRRRIAGADEAGPVALSAEQQRSLTPKRRKVVRGADGAVEIQGGPGPRIAGGFGEHIEDPLAVDEDDDLVPALAPDDSDPNPDNDETSDIDAANAATAAARAAQKSAEGEAAEGAAEEGEPGEAEEGTETPETGKKGPPSPAVRIKAPRGAKKVVDETAPEPEKFPCPHCEFEAITRAGLSSHVNAKHPG